jgi:hypothetical protein
LIPYRPRFGALIWDLVMLISCFSELVAAASDIDVNNQTAKQNWRDLYSVYNSALNDAPEGVIGVGAITYAESQLVAFQNNKGIK